MKDEVTGKRATEHKTDILIKEGVEVTEFGFSGILCEDGSMRVLVYFDDRWRALTTKEATSFCTDLMDCIHALEAKQGERKK